MMKKPTRDDKKKATELTRILVSSMTPGAPKRNERNRFREYGNEIFF